MILADKIIYLRKKLGMTQEELASKMDVSRQSVSKWESTMSMPDINKIMKLSEIFGVSTDFLLDDNKEIKDISEFKDEKYSGRIIEVDEANHYIKMQEKFSSIIALAVLLFILGPAIFMLISALGKESLEMAGVVIIIALVAVSIGICIKAGIDIEEFDYIGKEPYEFAYGVRGLLDKNRKEYRKKHGKYLVFGIGIIILSSLPLLIAQGINPDLSEKSEDLFVALMLLIIAIGAATLTKTVIKADAFDSIIKNQDDYYMEKSKKFEKIDGIYWISVTIIYLATSFIFDKWAISWIVWPIAGLLRAIIGIAFDE